MKIRLINPLTSYRRFIYRIRYTCLAGVALTLTYSGAGQSFNANQFLGTSPVNIASGALLTNVQHYGILNISTNIQSTGGNARGPGATDLQVSRIAATQVASGTNSTIGGGYDNIASAQGATVVGGEHGFATADYSTILGGTGNKAYGLYSIAGGFDNFATGWGSVAIGMTDARAEADASTIVGASGSIVHTNADQSCIFGSHESEIFSSEYAGIVGGGSANFITNSSFSGIAGGYINRIYNSVLAEIHGGQSNTVSSAAAAHIVGNSIVATEAYGVYLGYGTNAVLVKSDGSVGLPGLSGNPSNPVAGQIYFNSGNGHFYGYNGSSWKQLDN